MEHKQVEMVFQDFAVQFDKVQKRLRSEPDLNDFVLVTDLIMGIIEEGHVCTSKNVRVQCRSHKLMAAESCGVCFGTGSHMEHQVKPIKMKQREPLSEIIARRYN